MQMMRDRISPIGVGTRPTSSANRAPADTESTMTSTRPKPGDFSGEWDPVAVKRACDVIRPLAKVWHRSEVHDLEHLAAAGALVVSNHSGGMFPMDLPVIAIDFFEKFGYERPFYTLSHDIFFRTPIAGQLIKAGFLRASRRNAQLALQSGATVLVFPGGDYDAYRPTRSANAIDFGGRTGYINTALNAGVPIVPAVSIGGQENQIYLSRGEWLAKVSGLRRLLRTDILPITLGVPFGLSAFLPVNLPIPTKIVTEILEPVHVADQFGEQPDLATVDRHVRAVMQNALDRLADERRWPILG
jgi:1-acyl-sn-glycerol-3-phosphate acyltransferase